MIGKYKLMGRNMSWYLIVWLLNYATIKIFMVVLKFIFVKPTRNGRRGPALRLCRERFRKRKYKRRKNGERGAKIYDENVMLYTDPVRQRVKIRLMAVGYNVKRLIKLSIKYESVMKLVMWLT